MSPHNPLFTLAYLRAILVALPSLVVIFFISTRNIMSSKAMGLTKQAKVLSKRQVSLMVGHLDRTRYPIRNRVILLLSIKAGLRAKEIAQLTWAMVTDAEGNLASTISLRNSASKGKKGGGSYPFTRT
jgi:integrase